MSVELDCGFNQHHCLDSMEYLLTQRLSVTQRLAGKRCHLETSQSPTLCQGTLLGLSHPELPSRAVLWGAGRRDTVRGHSCLLAHEQAATLLKGKETAGVIGCKVT